jgi:hypothetical protein
MTCKFTPPPSLQFECIFEFLAPLQNQITTFERETNLRHLVSRLESCVRYPWSAPIKFQPDTTQHHINHSNYICMRPARVGHYKGSCYTFFYILRGDVTTVQNLQNDHSLMSCFKKITFILKNVILISKF